MSNRGFYHNPESNVSDLSGKVEGSVRQVTEATWQLADPDGGP